MMMVVVRGGDDGGKERARWERTLTAQPQVAGCQEGFVRRFGLNNNSGMA